MLSSWPLFALRVRTPRIELRAPTDDDLGALLDVARRGVHAPEAMPFIVPWTDRTGADFDLGFLQYFWGARASWSVNAWNLPLAVVVDGCPIGVQSLGASRFSVLRTVDTGSWLGRSQQGRGLGTEMRYAALGLAFDALGAEFATTGALEGNRASTRVTEKLGYAPNGERRVAPRGVAVCERCYRMDRAHWRSIARSDITVDGFEACAPMFGLSASVGLR